MHTQKDQFRFLLRPLYLHMQLARTAYARYTGHRILLHAEAIRKANRKICRLLASKSDYIPAALQPDIPVLLEHYDSWFGLFSEHKKKHKPSLTDEFIFNRPADQPAFPRQIEDKIFSYYEQVKKELAVETRPEQSFITNH